MSACTHTLLTCCWGGLGAQHQLLGQPQLPPALASAMGTGWELMDVPQPGVMEHCSSLGRPSLPNWCQQGKLSQEEAEAGVHLACLCLSH